MRKIFFLLFAVIFSNCILSCGDDEETTKTYLRYTFSCDQTMYVELKDKNGKLIDLHVNSENFPILIGNVPSKFVAFCRGGFDEQTYGAKGVISIEISDNNIDFYPVKMATIKQKYDNSIWDFIEYTIP